MKYFFIILLYFPSIAQNVPDTEIYLFDLVQTNGKIFLENGKNISQNPGYDNQPSFYSNDTLIYSRTRGNQTDIAGYQTGTGKHSWYSNTEQGSEFSPKRIPKSKQIAAVRLDTTGLQRLYQYDPKTMNNSILVPDLKIGYFVLFNENKLLTSVLTGSGMDLYINNLEEGISVKLVSNVGRSLHKVPNTDFVSYTVINDEKSLDLYLMEFNEDKYESFFICTLPAGVQDYTWLNSDKILIGNGTELHLYNTLSKPEWTKVADLSGHNLENITRIAISDDGSKMSFAAEPVVPGE